MRINEILTILQQLPYFTKQNLPLALRKEGEDLNYWIKKLMKEKLLVPLKKGFYISPYYQKTMIRDPAQSEIYWIYLANVLRGPSYVSGEYVLSKYNLIPETAFAITSVTLKSSRKYISQTATFIYRHIKKELFYGYQLMVFGNSGLTARIAYPYKALFDFLYLRPFSSQEEMKDYLIEKGRFNWDALSDQNKKEFIKTCNLSSSRKMLLIVSILKKEKIL